MIYNIIPVNYFSGLGGQFLSSFLHAARENISNTFIFSKDGNSHDSDKDWGPPYHMGQDLTGVKNIDVLTEYSKTISANKIEYPHGHFGDPDLLMQHVHKQIKIYYEYEQINEITGVFMLKHPSTSDLFQDLTDSEIIEKYKNHHVVRFSHWHKTKFARLCNNCPDLEPRMLNISWNDMLYNDPELLISKLHQFTEIPEENFNREKFNEWRMLTHNTVNKLKQAGIV